MGCELGNSQNGETPQGRSLNCGNLDDPTCLVFCKTPLHKLGHLASRLGHLDNRFRQRDYVVHVYGQIWVI